MMFNHLPRNPGHLWWLPGKHINIIPEEGDKHEFQFVAQVPQDGRGLGGICANLDDLHMDILVV
jgi:hypothetical protein